MTSSADGTGSRASSSVQLLLLRSDKVDWCAATGLTRSLSRLESAESEYGQGELWSADASIDASAYFMVPIGYFISDEIRNPLAPLRILSHA